MDDVRNWRRQAKKLNDQSLAVFDESKFPTRLLPNNYGIEEAIRRVIKIHPPGGMVGYRLPFQDLTYSWRISCPDVDFERFFSLAGDVCCALQSHFNKPPQGKEKGFEPPESVN